MIYNLKYVNNYGKTINFSWESGIVVSSKTGFSENHIEYATSQGLNQVGTSIQGKATQQKQIIINGTIVGPSIEKKQNILDTIIPEDNGKLIFNNTWFINVSPINTPEFQAGTRDSNFQFTLLAPYPYWYKTDETTIMLAGKKPLFRFPWNMQLPYKFSENITEVAGNVENKSNIQTNFKVIFTAFSPTDFPMITKVGTNEFIRINKKMASNEIVIVDMFSGGLEVSSTLDGETTYNIGYVDFESTIFTLDPGKNVIRYEADGDTKNLEILIKVNETIVGVVT